VEYRENILETIGNTPLVKLNKVTDGAKPLVLAKVEYFNPGASVKDRIGIAMIERFEREGLLKPGGTIVEGTSGNTGVGLAIAAAIKGYRCIFTTTDKQAIEKVRLLRAFGAEVIVCPTAVPPDHPDSYYSVAKRLAAETPNAVYPNQYDNQDNPRAHYKTTGPEIWRQTDGKITHLFAGVGTGGTISGIGKFLKEKNPKIKVIGLDPVGSILKEVKDTGEYHPEHAHTYKVEGIGEDIVPTTVWFDVIDEILKVTDKESFIASRRLAREEGIFAGGSAGTAIAGMMSYIRRERLGPDAVCVVIVPDWGGNYTAKLHNDEWMRENRYLDETTPRATIGQVLPPHEQGALISVAWKDTVRRGVELMNRHGINQIPVVGEKGEIVGTLLEGDILSKALANPGVLDRTAEGAMGPPLPSLDAGESVERAIELVKTQPAVLVLEKGAVRGIVTKYDLVRFLAKR